MKALEKDRDAALRDGQGVRPRYRPFLDGRPGRGGSTVGDIQAPQAARKHRAVLVTTTAFAGLLLLAAAISTYLAIQAARAEAEARRQRTRPKLSEIGPSRLNGPRGPRKRRPGSPRPRRRKSEAEARAVLEFFQTKVLAARGPGTRRGAWACEATIRDAVDAAVPAIEKSFAGKPTVEASIHDTMGQSYSVSGRAGAGDPPPRICSGATAAGPAAPTTPTR